MASPDEVFSLVASKFKISSLNTHQKTAISAVTEKKKMFSLTCRQAMGNRLFTKPYRPLLMHFDQVQDILLQLLVL